MRLPETSKIEPAMTITRSLDPSRMFWHLHKRLDRQTHWKFQNDLWSPPPRVFFYVQKCEQIEKNAFKVSCDGRTNGIGKPMDQQIIK